MRPILLIGTTEDFAQRFQESVGEEDRSRVWVWPRPVMDGGAEALDYTNPAVLVVGPSLVTDVAFDIAEQVHAQRPDVGIIVVQRSDTPRTEGAGPGVSAILPSTPDAEAVRAAVQAASRVEARAASRAATTAETILDPGSAPAPVAPRGKVTTIISPKGGAGKTVISTNLAVGLAAAAPRGVVIVDLDVQFGDVAYLLGLKPRHTLFDVISSPGDLDITTLKVFLTHHDSDLYALCAPDDPARGEMVTVEAVDQIIGLLAAEFDHVVIDTCAGLTEHALSTVEASTDVVFVADMDVPSVRHLTKVVAALDRLGMKDHKRHFVLNRADARVGLSMMAAANKAGLEIDLQLPIAKQVPVSINQGSPIITSDPKNQVSKRLWELVERIGGAGAPRQGSGLLRWSA